MVKQIPLYLASLCTMIWVGGTWAVGYLAVPVLFRTLADHQLAGLLAGKMFTLMGNIGIVCAIYLLAYQFLQFGGSAWKRQYFLLVASMLVILLVILCGIQPIMADLKIQAMPLDVMQSALASKFKVLHGVSSVLYLLQSLLGVVLALKTVPTKNISA
jgi:predicted neutral ceramidase superfamily lipid hydrolase